MRVLFCPDLELFCPDHELFCPDHELFRPDHELFCPDLELFCSALILNCSVLSWSWIVLFCPDLELFCNTTQIVLFCPDLELFCILDNKFCSVLILNYSVCSFHVNGNYWQTSWESWITIFDSVSRPICWSYNKTSVIKFHLNRFGLAWLEPLSLTAILVLCM